MRKRTVIGLIGASAAFLTALAGAQSAGADPTVSVRAASENYCEGDWQYNGWPPDYCKTSGDSGDYYVEFINNTGREIRVFSHTGQSGDWVRKFTSRPDRTKEMRGTGTGLLTVSWCPADKYTVSCEGHKRATLTWGNPWVGWPWMKVNGDEESFKSLERHTFEEAYSVRPGAWTVVKFKVQRLEDRPESRKRWVIDMSFAAR